MNTAPIRAARHAPSQIGGSGGSFIFSYWFIGSISADCDIEFISGDADNKPGIPG
jgi:hypothetical protein